MMKKFLFAVFVILFSFILPKVALAQDTGYYPAGYVVNSFDSEVLISEDSSIDITETLEVTFFENRHGIIRVIPAVYSSKGRTIKAKLVMEKIVDEIGSAHPYTKSRLSQSIKLKIGDPDRTITGKKTYIIHYRITKVLQQFEEHDELYWNVTGGEWDTDILSSRVNVESPYAQVTQVECFAGPVGTKSNLCQSGKGKNIAEFTAKDLGSGKDFSIIVGLSKKGTIHYPGFIDRTLGFIFDNWGYLIAILPATIMFWIWYRRGRDRRYLSDNVYYKPDKVKTKTVALFARPHLPLVYHPLDGLSPSEVGTIVDERVNIHDIVAEIIELARLGFITIEQINVKKLIGKSVEYAFIKTEKYNDNIEKGKLKDYQKYLLKELFKTTYISKSLAAAEKLFESNKGKLDVTRRKLANKEYVLLSSLKNNLYKGLSGYKEKLYKRMKTEGFFAGNPDKEKTKWIAIYLGIVFAVSIVLMIFVVATFNFGPLILYPLVVIAGLFLMFSMPKRTPKGYSLFRQIKGLKWYLEKGKWRYEHMEKKLFFEEILPLAIALRTVDKLAKEMKDIGVKPPSYYGGSNMNSFAKDFGKFYGASTSSILSAPSSSNWSGKSSWSGGSGFSGGGSSGGGFGGGGGGSW